MDWLPRKVSTGLSLRDTSYGVSSVATKRWRDRCEREWFLRLDGGTDYAVDESYSHGVQGFYASSPHSPSIRTKDCFVSWITSCLHSRQRDLGSKRTTTQSSIVENQIYSGSLTLFWKATISNSSLFYSTARRSEQRTKCNSLLFPESFRLQIKKKERQSFLST